MLHPQARTHRWLRLAVSSAMLGSLLAAVSAGVHVEPARAAACPAGTTTRNIGWGATAGIVWDDAIQNDGHSITYPSIGGGPVDMTMTIIDPSNMNEDQDNPLVNLPTTDGNWDTPFYTATDGAYGPGYLTMVMTSENSDQEVTFALEFSAPVVLGEFSIGDIDYVGNNAPPSEQLHDSFQDEILLSARRGSTPVAMTGTTGTPGSPVITLNDPANGLFRVAGGPYDQNTNGNLAPGDAAGTATIETSAPITSVTFGYSNGPDDAAGDAAALAAAGGAWPAENWVAPLTATSTGVSNNHAVRINIFTVCTGELTIGDRVWTDIDGDGVQDPSEPGISGVTVELLGQDGIVIGTTTTAADGTYAFTDLPPWDYSVRISDTPVGYASTHDRDSGTTAPDGDSGTIALTTSDVDDADFGLQPPLGTVSGTVFADRDDDGDLDAPADTGIGGVTVTLSGTDDAGNTVDRTTTTSADGTYGFTDVPAGTYTVTETQPADYTDGIDTPGTNAAADGDDQHAVTLGLGDSSIGNDFAEIATASIAGTVFEDGDDDGQPDPLEAGIGGVTVTLFGTDEAGNAVSLSTTTAGDGTYSFDRLRPGTYTLTETQPAAYADGRDDAGSEGGDTTTNDTIASITLGAGVDATDYDFGEIVPSAISGTVVDDNGDPIPGVTITLSGDATDTTTTGTDGTYTFGDLLPGTYTVTETQPAGYGDGGETAGTAGGDDTTDDVISGIVLGADEIATGYDFDETTGSISGAVVDDNGDPIPGVTITLSGDATGTTTTGADGTYVFDDLLAGTYTVTETQPVAFADGGETAGSEGGDDTTDDVISGIVLPGGVDATGYDFDELRQGSISGIVVDDLGNPIPGVTVTLSGDGTGTTTTGPDGRYVFGELDPGSYTVTEAQPAGYGDGGETAGSTGGDDTTDDVISGITLAAGESSLDNDFDETTSSISGTVVDDLGRPIPGVEITLTGTDVDGPVSSSVTTGPDGGYTFDGLLAGTYTVTEAQPTGYGDGGESAGSTGGDDTTDDAITDIVLAGGEHSERNDFDETTGAISGAVVDDDGQPIGGVTITLTGSDIGGAVEATTTTAPDGTYTFDGLLAGTYTVTEAQPSSHLDGGETAGTAGGTDSADDVISGIELGGGEQSERNDFDELRPAEISGSVVDDLGRPIPGVEITLTGTDDRGPVTVTVITGPDGGYTFDGLRPGTYVVVETQPEGYGDGRETTADPMATVSDDRIEGITLGAGDTEPDNDFDETTSSVEGSVVDERGRGLAGVEITLTGTDVHGNEITLITTTDENGEYSFDGLVAGTYGLIEAQPDGYVDGGEHAGSTGGTVSDDRITDITLGAGVASVDNDFDEQLVAGQATDNGDDVPATLAFTGAGTMSLVWLSIVLAFAGSLLIGVDRRRRKDLLRLDA